MNIKAKQENVVILQDQQSGSPRWLMFENPEYVVTTNNVEDVVSCLDEIDKHINDGMYAAGFLSYEAALGIDPSLDAHELDDFPYLWFGIYKDHKEIELPDPAAEKNYKLDEWEPAISWQNYNDAMDKIRHHIREGDTYQVNYTFRLRSQFSGDPWQLFLNINRAQQSEFSAFINAGDHVICSVSPEIFFTLNGDTLLSRPMKGTLRRGYTTGNDLWATQWLHMSEKNRAENLMIVDMIRNDASRIAEVGSVKVTKLFAIEKYPTVHQMTSTVVAKTQASATDIIKNMFPCASITGAPKVKTMQIIKDVEPDARGIYTGSIGYISPERQSQFNVSIRTVAINTKDNSAEYGVGGGITWYSDTSSEYDECLAKAAVLNAKFPVFELLESLRWDDKQGYHYLEQHLERLADSANYFDYPLTISDVTAKLNEYAAELSGGPYKVRLKVCKKGQISIDSVLLESIVGRRVELAKNSVNTNSPYFYHKTTQRDFYDQALSESPDAHDVILYNENDLITESTIANIIIAKDGKLYTPEVESGLLLGAYLRVLIHDGLVETREIAIEELRQADHVFLVNSVRGCMSLEAEGNDAWRIAEETTRSIEFVLSVNDNENLAANPEGARLLS